MTVAEYQECGIRDPCICGAIIQLAEKERTIMNVANRLQDFRTSKASRTQNKIKAVMLLITEQGDKYLSNKGKQLHVQRLCHKEGQYNYKIVSCARSLCCTACCRIL